MSLSKEAHEEIRFGVLFFGALFGGYGVQVFGLITFISVCHGHHWANGVLGALAVAYICIGLLLMLFDLLGVYGLADNGNELAMANFWVRALFSVQFIMLFLLATPKMMHKKALTALRNP